MEWQPIDTCPMKNGKKYLITKDCGHGTLQSVSIAFRLDGIKGWIFNDDISATLEGYGYRATHWMPLPAMPSEA